jgi:hypothetical protein
VDCSFEGFYAEQADTLRRALYLALGDLDVALDASDEALTWAFAQWHQVQTYANPAGWVYRVGLNWAVSVRRRNMWRDRRMEEPAFPTVSALAPDGSSLAVVAASNGLAEPTELIVYDLTTGAIRHRQQLDLMIGGAQISYDGTTVAVGSAEPASPAKVTVVDLRTGAHHDLDVRGLLA